MDHAISSTNASGTASFKYRLGGTDADGDGDVFLFVATGETSANFVPCKTPGPTVCTLRPILTLAPLSYRVIDLTFEQAVRCRSAVPVNPVIWRYGIFGNCDGQNRSIETKKVSSSLLFIQHLSPLISVLLLLSVTTTANNFDNGKVDDGCFQRQQKERTKGKGKVVCSSSFYPASSPSNFCSTLTTCGNMTN